LKQRPFVAAVEVGAFIREREDQRRPFVAATYQSVHPWTRRSKSGHPWPHFL